MPEDEVEDWLLDDEVLGLWGQPHIGQHCFLVGYYLEA
jgi:hypothetical protein